MNILQIGSPFKKFGGVSNHIQIIKSNRISKKINESLIKRQYIIIKKVQ